MSHYLRKLLACGALVAPALLAGCATTGGGRDGVTKAPPAAVQRAYDQMAAGDFTAAEPTWRKLTRKEPKLAAAHVNLGIVLANTDRGDEAVTALRKGIELDGSSAAAHNQLGIVLRKAGDFAAAEAAYRAALAAEPGFAKAHFNLGVLYDLYLARPDEALQAYQQYLALSGSGDKQVLKWVAELSRRTSSIADATKVMP